MEIFVYQLMVWNQSRDNGMTAMLDEKKIPVNGDNVRSKS